MKVTIIYKVYGCDNGGSPVLDTEFFSAKDACSYATAKRGKIHYGLPQVYEYSYHYDPKTQMVLTNREELTEEQIYAMAEASKEEKE